MTVELAYDAVGDPGRPPVVLLHALGEDRGDWCTVVDALVATHRAYVVDLRGHGQSPHPGSYSLQLMCEDVLLLLGALELESVALIGHSLGGLVACLVAATAPARVHTLVVEDVPVLVPSVPPRDAPPRPPEPVSFDWRVVEAVTRERNHPDPTWADRTRGITARTLVIAGGPTSHIPQDGVAQLAELIPGAQLVTIDAGHLVHETRPDDFIAVVTGFLQHHAGSTRP